MGFKRGKVGGGGFSVPGWAWLVPCLLAPVVLLNVAIAWLGDTHVSPLSFTFLEAKAGALRAYAEHRPACLLEGHEELGPVIDAAERRHRLPPGLLRALVEVESESRVHRISPAGAMGPGQLMPTTAEMLGVEDPFDPKPAIDASARYLAEQLRRFRGDVRLAVAAYNAGPGAVRGRVPRNGETEYYVPKVLKAWEHTKPPAPRPAPPVKRVAASKPVPRTPPPGKPAPAVKPQVQAKPSAPARAKPPTAAGARAKPAVTGDARRG